MSRKATTKEANMSKELVPVEVIENRIYLIRGQKVMLDSHLAALYEVTTKRLNERVKRNIRRFPADFMFQLTIEEEDNLRSQFATSNLKSPFVTSSRGGRRYLPFVFTEQGVAMLSSVLNSERAILVNIAIMRAFVRLRQMIANNKELSNKIDLLEKRVFKHDSDIRGLVRDIRRLSLPKPGLRNKVGFLK
jgi:hypothetical protein